MSPRMVWILAVLLTVGCAQGPPRPVEIEDGEACALCRMAISEKGYASELIDLEQRVHKFDDIGCMLRFARDRRLAGSREVHVFVRDYDGRDWLRGEDAHYIQSPQIPSPMASGIIAAADRPRAERHAAKLQGRVLVFAEIWKP